MIALRGTTRSAVTTKVASFLAKNSAASIKTTSYLLPKVAQPKLQELLVPTTSRTFSTNFISTSHVSLAPDSTRSLGTVTRTLKALEASVVKKIEAELTDVDKDADGR